MLKLLILLRSDVSEYCDTLDMIPCLVACIAIILSLKEHEVDEEIADREKVDAVCQTDDG